MISNVTKLNAVIGYPLSHSLSPVLHTHIYEQLGIDALMLAFPSQDVKRTIRAIRDLNIGLTAVTAPFKEKVLPLLSVIEEVAREIGSVNTILNESGKLTGYNTDIAGIKAALKGVLLRKRKVLIVGAGGVALTMGYYAASCGSDLYYMNRTPAHARRLAKRFGGTVIDQEELRELGPDVIVNTTSLGMSPKVAASPLPGYHFRKGQTVFDLIYNPFRTKLLLDASRSGARTVSGLDMFAAQAVAQVRLWSGKNFSNEKALRFLKNKMSKS